MTASRRTNIRLHQKLGLVAFGLFLTFLILKVALRLGGFVILSLQAHQNAISMRQTGAYRIMCIGESTTQGQYPALLEQVLNGRNLGIRFSVIDRGLVGARTSFLLDRLESDLDTYHPKMVVAMMGINDNGPHMPYEPETSSKIVRFIRTLRTYKLTRIAWLHIASLERHAAQEITRRNDGEYVGLGWVYREQGKFAAAQAAFRQALEINRRNDRAYVGLGCVYRDQGESVAAEAAFKQALEINPEDAKTYGALSTVYVGMGNQGLAKRYHEKAEELRLQEYDSVVAGHYHRLKEILDRRGLKLVCVQYPMRSLEPLRKMFQGRDDGIIFVDNEKIFRDAVQKSPLKEYFRDMFAGDFGHCTRKCNELLAKNIADVLSREFFKK